MTEHEIQTKAVKEVRKLGFICVVTSQRKKNVTRGIPDVFVTYPGILNRWFAVDFKRPKGKITQEQADMAVGGMLYICDSVEKFIFTANEFKKGIK